MAKQQTTKPDQTRSIIRITCSSPDAREIMLTGSFNDWDSAALPMTRNADGQWSTDLELSRGRYEYTFLVDGVLCCEPHLKNGYPDCEQCAPHACGELHRILLVR